jgi:hypothetical protein
VQGRRRLLQPSPVHARSLRRAGGEVTSREMRGKRARPLPTLALLAVLFTLPLSACGSSNSGSGAPSNTGQACSDVSQCYRGVSTSSLLGAPSCLTAVPGGYCTHACGADSDCCAASGECPYALAEVCAPFESTGAMDCFLSCEAGPRAAAPTTARCASPASGPLVGAGGGRGGAPVTPKAVTTERALSDHQESPAGLLGSGGWSRARTGRGKAFGGAAAAALRPQFRGFNS